MSKCMICQQVGSTFTIRNCNHIFCHKCTVNHLSTLNNAKIKCPKEGCVQFVQDSVIRECLSNNQIKLYDTLCHSKNVFKCLIKECTFVMAYEKKDIQFQCPICQQPNCMKCSTMHFPNQKCFAKDQNAFENAASKYIRETKRKYIESYDEKEELLPNSESFECLSCTLFILPRKGITIRNCLHNFCKDCLKYTYDESTFINQLVCPICSAPLKEKESRALVGTDKLKLLSLNPVKPRFYNCKQSDCDMFWDIGNFKGTHKCSKCKTINCISCDAVHEPLTCAQYKESKAFKCISQFQKTLRKDKYVSCFKCKRLLMKKEGTCGALKCDSCYTYVCAFTGKSVGPDGCNCTSKKPCHTDCKFGCIPE